MDWKLGRLKDLRTWLQFLEDTTAAQEASKALNHDWVITSTPYSHDFNPVRSSQALL